MNSIIKKYNIILNIFIIFITISYLFDFKKYIQFKEVVDIIGIIFIIFTIFLSYFSYRKNNFEPFYGSVYSMVLVLLLMFFIIRGRYDNTAFLEVSYFLVLPFSLVLLDDIRVSDRVFGLLIIIFGICAFFDIGYSKYLLAISPFLIAISVMLIYKEDNLIIKLIYILSNSVLLFMMFNKLYYSIFLILFEAALLALDEKQKHQYDQYLYMSVFAVYIILMIFELTPMYFPFYVIGAVMFKNGLIKEKYNLIFYANDLSIGGIENSLVNLLNSIDKKIFNVTLVLENKKGPLLKKIDKSIYIRKYKVFNFRPIIIRKVLNLIKRVFYSIFNYNTYDFSCCYTTYSYCGNKLSKIVTKNSSIYVHSDYFQAYKKEKDALQFFNSREMDKFKKIIFVSNESRDEYLKRYPNQKEKTFVFNNIIDIDKIESKKKEIVEFRRPKGKKLLVFVGRLEEESKRVSRLIDIANSLDNVIIWIIGDGKDRSKYEKMIKKHNLQDRVKMYGAIEEPYSYMNRADYIILTSDYEGFPVVYLEALALKKEIITTIAVSDDKINMKERASIISKDGYVEDVRQIIKGIRKKNSEFNYREVQYGRIRAFERMFKE